MQSFLLRKVLLLDRWLHNMCCIPGVYLGFAQIPSGTTHQSSIHQV